VILYPTSGGLERVGLLAEALQNIRFLRADNRGATHPQTPDA